jgi:hypothetical protein
MNKLILEKLSQITDEEKRILDGGAVDKSIYTDGEEFTVKYQVSKYKWCIEYHLTFTDKGLTHYGKTKDIILRQLLAGKAVIVDE